MQTSPSGSRFQCTCSQIKYNTHLPYPQSRNKLVSCLHENLVYIYAGKDGTISLKDFWRFNIGNNAWQQVRFRGDQPSHLEGHTLVSCKKLLLLFGGEFGDSLTESSLWIINPDLGCIRKAHLDPGSERPSVRRHHSAVVYHGSMFVYGGYVDMKGSSSELWQYRIDDEEWDLLLPRQPVQNTPTGLHGHSAVVYNKYMWVYGGMSNLVPKQDFWCYNFVSGRWERVKTKYGPPALMGHSAVVVDTQMFIYGGEWNREPVSQLWCFCFKTELWTHLTFHQQGPSARMFHSAVVVAPSSKADGTVKASSMPYLQNKMRHLKLERPRSSPSSGSQGGLYFSDEHFRDKVSPNSSRPQILNLKDCGESNESLKIIPSPSENTQERSPLVPKKTDLNYNILQSSIENCRGIDNPGISKSTEELIRENKALRLSRLNQQNEELNNKIPFLRTQSQSVGSLCDETHQSYIRQNSAGFDITDIPPNDDLVYKICAKRLRHDPDLIIEDLEYKDCFPYDIKLPYPSSKMTSIKFVGGLNSSMNPNNMEGLETIELVDLRGPKETDETCSQTTSHYKFASRNQSSNSHLNKSENCNIYSVFQTDNNRKETQVDNIQSFGNPGKRGCILNKAMYHNTDIETQGDTTPSIYPVSDQQTQGDRTHSAYPMSETKNRICETDFISEDLHGSKDSSIGAETTRNNKGVQLDSEPYMLVFGGKEKLETNFTIRPLPVWQFKLKKL